MHQEALSFSSLKSQNNSHTKKKKSLFPLKRGGWLVKKSLLKLVWYHGQHNWKCQLHHNSIPSDLRFSNDIKLQEQFLSLGKQILVFFFQPTHPFLFTVKEMQTANRSFYIIPLHMPEVEFIFREDSGI